ncbi:unnamed protein product [Cuscuta epithymum]|uniref:Uncharacterized protein n=1 Tax=Cuscuta epithymum TaxID=186058 RepID=A0AAV0EYU5_9ASTE|nr:unnamed protein product [Cuscuta epithymum]
MDSILHLIVPCPMMIINLRTPLLLLTLFFQVHRSLHRKRNPMASLRSKQLFYEVGYTSHPMITRSQSRYPQHEDDYYIYHVDARLNSPHKLATALQRYKSSHSKAIIYHWKAIQFHNRFNRSISSTVGIPTNNFNCQIHVFYYIFYFSF